MRAARALFRRVVHAAHGRSARGRAPDLPALRPPALGRGGGTHATPSGNEPEGPPRSARVLARAVRTRSRRRARALPRLLGPLARTGRRLIRPPMSGRSARSRLLSVAYAGLAGGVTLFTAVIVYFGVGEITRTLA